MYGLIANPRLTCRNKNPGTTIPQRFTPVDFRSGAISELSVLYPLPLNTYSSATTQRRAAVL
jgi:hypothetical protein